ncbi:MAG: aminopeptidase [Eubacterium sp.]|nr:aminopeptidase [Eubacterium sp.]
MDFIKERYDISIERIKEITKEGAVKAPFADFFEKSANFVVQLDCLYQMVENESFLDLSIEELQEMNHQLYQELNQENYEESYANPAYAVKMLGETYGQLLCYLYVQNRKLIRYAMQQELELITIQLELFIEIYNYFEQLDSVEEKDIFDTVYSFEKDNSEIFVDRQVDLIVNPNRDYYTKIVMESDLEDLRYLYHYGEEIGENEIKMAQFLNGLPQEKIELIAKTYTEGFRVGFVKAGKPLEKKKAVQVRYNIGFERIVRKAIENFAEMGLRPVIYAGGVVSTGSNHQVEFDHKNDLGLYLDKAFVKRSLEVRKQAYEERKKLAGEMAGPAVIEIFGEAPFEPASKKEAISLSEEQQKMKVEFANEISQITQQYIKGDERSFTIIAFPIPEFGENFEEMFEETIRINTLDATVYEKVQQTIIDTLDLADYVRVEGKGKNKTYINVQLQQLRHPEKETKFENCVADVNIPLGEVFTSPKLSGTNGKLHVSQVYLNGLKFIDLEMDFEDGKITRYTCKNFEEEEENKKYIKDNILFHHETLPIGEFAIGTNTTAYVIANRYDVVYKLPILIVEKMGPHFAVGDTCYSWEEEVKVFNPDGKEIIARDNEMSILRKKDVSKAYFGCHTDITLPYEELQAITAVTKDGKEIDIIRDGRFVLEGTDLLNEAFDKA